MTRYRCGESLKDGRPCPYRARWFASVNPFCVRCGRHAKHPSPSVIWMPL